MEWCKYVELNRSAKQQYLCMDITRASMQFQDGCGPTLQKAMLQNDAF